MNTQCSQCKYPHPPDSKFCPSCGMSFATVKRKNSLLIILATLGGTLFLCMFCGVVGAFINGSKEKQPVTLAAKPTPNASAAILAKAKATLNSNATKEEKATASYELGSIPNTDKEYKEAQELISDYSKQRNEQIAEEMKNSSLKQENELKNRSGSNNPSSATNSSIYLVPRASDEYYHLGPRGGCYVVTSGGRKKYVDRSLCH